MGLGGSSPIGYNHKDVNKMDNIDILAIAVIANTISILIVMFGSRDKK